MTSVGSIEPRFYGLPTYTKLLNSQTYTLYGKISAKAIGQMFKQFVKSCFEVFSRSVVKDSFKFVDKLKHQKANDTFLCFFYYS